MSLLLLMRSAEVAITTPAAAARVLVGETVTIDATEIATSGEVNVSLSIDNGVTFATIASGVVLPYAWVPTSGQIAPQAVLRVQDSVDTLLFDDQSIIVASTFAVATQAETERLIAKYNGVRDWGVVGDAPILDLDAGDNGFASWMSVLYDGSSRHKYYTASDGAGSYKIRHTALDSSGLPTGARTTVLTGDQSYDQAGAFLPVVRREGTTLHMLYSGMPSLFTQNNICYATGTTSNMTSFTKQGAIIPYSSLPEWLHAGAEPTDLYKVGSTYYMILCSTHGGSAAALGASVMDRRSAIAVASSMAGPWTFYPLMCETTGPSYQEPWLYLISGTRIAPSSSATALNYLIGAAAGANTDFQQLELFESSSPRFAKEFTRHVGTILSPREEGEGFPDWEIDVVSVLTDDISKNTFSSSGGALWMYFGGKSMSDGAWRVGLSKPATTVAKALRPPIHTRVHRLSQQIPLRSANSWEREQVAGLLLSTTISAVNGPTEIVLANGSPDNNAYRDKTFVFTDDTNALQKSSVSCSEYVGSTRTVTLLSSPAFTVAVGDRVDVLAAGAVSSSGGTGPRTVTITVTDGTDPLQTARISLKDGVNLFVGTTNASGVATFNVDDATYTVAITKAGYTFAGTTLVVDGTETVTYAMTAVAITPSTGDFTTGVLTVLTAAGAAASGVMITVEQRTAPDSSFGFAFDGEPRTVTSNGSGIAQIPGMVKGATYKVYRGDRQGYDCKIPVDAGGTYELPSIVGVTA